MSVTPSGEQARVAALIWNVALPMRLCLTHTGPRRRNNTTAISTTSTIAATLSSKPAGLAAARCLTAQLWQPLWAIATLANPYQHFDFTYGAPGQDQQDAEQTPVTNATYQQLLTQGFQPQDQYLSPQSQHHAVQSFPQYGIAPILPSQVTAPEPSYTIDQPQMVPTQMQRAMSTVSSSHYGTPHETPELLRYQPAASAVRKRSHQSDYSYDYQALQLLQAQASSSAQLPVELTPHGHHAQLQSGASSYYVPSQRASPQHNYPQQQSFQTMQPQTHHHHRLPNQPPPPKSQRLGDPTSSTDKAPDDHGPPSMVGHAGMPTPAPKPKGPKLKFTADDDALLVELKETKNLTWKQIADFFPGRTSGTLQVRYCTKLKAKSSAWSDDLVQKLRAAMEEYENDRWRVISGKIGNGFSAAACREKAEELALLSFPEEGAGAGATVLEEVPLTMARGGARQHGTRAAVAAASASASTSTMASTSLPTLRTTGLSQQEGGETGYGLPNLKAREGA
ncbi:hypothetical protein LTR91_005714 [Friedmanniomyces endolithicus]|uniref:Myb-like domain-containing protein n=1 Tax=Friedmanniomyces endolithicus TaxID=329885 RepID=A0AAN6FIJ7_9PEZI|nr:hypothetical protein LTR35_011451 [Friedmanniomyces endolithicus]KAK0288442.1 hypothetical protein LTS00_009653 [Friedmanniomyces endolithicus]KAK0317834.1 hypothetical protein LTR82_011095 [Friedmanniomyces endolithicus]KAK0919411.1 hypothetical protein LTR57_010794 [Friedmanniomyces endolithicus]KAK0980307.1 hypothetical protein LTR54_015363 [Friedmanniomyces endolithicus]